MNPEDALESLYDLRTGSLDEEAIPLSLESIGAPLECVLDVVGQTPQEMDTSPFCFRADLSGKTNQQEHRVRPL
jgi:hypothetical protein